MTCPKCKSDQVSDGTSGTLHCDACDYSWVAGGTRPRFLDAGVEKSNDNPGGTMIFILLVLLIAVALGFVSLLLAAAVAVLGLLAGILYYVAQLAGRQK